MSENCAGVAQELAYAGFDVVLVDISEAALSTARERMLSGTRLPNLLRRVRTSNRLEELRDAWVVIENITESWEKKRPLYLELDRICGGEAALAANSSTISITRFAAPARRTPPSGRRSTCWRGWAKEELWSKIPRGTFRMASPEDVDRVFTECLGHQMGPLATADLIGLDTVLYSLEGLRESLGDSRYTQLTLGRKTGRGFFEYGE